MKNTTINFMRQDIACSGPADVFDESDLAIMNKTYFAWKDMNEVYHAYGMRRANFPELLSEGLTSALFGYPRTNGTQISNLPSSSMDLIDLNTGDMIQLKACSTDKNNRPGPTSFGPASEFDRLLFLHMDCENDTAYWYELEAENYKHWKVNKTETIEDQQNQGRRPRVTILPKIKENNLKPIKTYQFIRA